MPYNTNNPTGTTGSTDPRDLYDNAANLDLMATSQTLTVVPDRLGQPRTTLHGYDVKANAVIDAMGMYRLADQTFGGGTTITSNKQLLLWAVEDGGTGFHYYWTAEIPSGGKVIPPGSTPASTGGEGPGGWLAWDDLEQRLADGSAFIGNVRSAVVAALSKYRLGSHFDLSGLWAMGGATTVITGDSLSFNFYGYMPGYVAEAKDMLLGARSWAALVRDGIPMKDKDFVYGDTLLGVVTAGTITVSHDLPAFTLPFNNRSTILNIGSDDGVFEFCVRRTNTLSDEIVLHLARVPGYPGQFDVYLDSGTGEVFASTVTLAPNPDNTGYSPHVVSIPYAGSNPVTPDRPVKVIFKNWRSSAGGPFPGTVKLAITAVGSIRNDVYLTGHGSWTAAMLAADFENRIGQYNPKVLIVIVGANDRYTLTPAQYEAGYRSVVEQALALNPAMTIVLMGAMPATDVGYRYETDTFNGYQMWEYLDVPAKLAAEYGLIFIDNYRAMHTNYLSNLLEGDNVHLGFKGNTRLFNIFAARMLGGTSGYLSHLNGVSTYGFNAESSNIGRQAILNDKTAAQNCFNTYVTASIVGGTWTVNSDFDPYKVVAEIDVPEDGRLRIRTNYHLKSGTVIPTALSVNVQQVGSSSTGTVIPRVFSYTGNSVTLVFADSDNNLMTTTELNGNSFKVSFVS